jgi:hypothetical protein
VKNLDLVDWTIREAQLLSIGIGSKEPTDQDDHSALVSTAQTVNDVPQASAPSGDSNTNTYLPPAGDAEAAKASTLAKAQFDAPLAALLKAIVEPGIDATRADRSRGITLRWTLRDIKNDRLKWWPIEHHDLWLLVELGLVEMRDDKPILTNAGLDVII